MGLELKRLRKISPLLRSAQRDLPFFDVTTGNKSLVELKLVFCVRSILCRAKELYDVFTADSSGCIKTQVSSGYSCPFSD